MTFHHIFGVTIQFFPWYAGNVDNMLQDDVYSSCDPHSFHGMLEMSTTCFRTISIHLAIFILTYEGIAKGCPAGMYGSNCLHKCPEHCQNNQCKLERGQTICENGCTDGFHGYSCNIPCKENCETCEQHTHKCLKCSKNFCGHFCNESCSRLSVNVELSIPCPNGYYGSECQFKCPVCDNVHVSERFACRNGCLDKTCEKQCVPEADAFGKKKQEMLCSPGTFGRACQHKCPDECLNGRCMMKRGQTVCLDGCARGYRGQICKIPCTANCLRCKQYGSKCIECKPPYTGDKCQCPCNGFLCTEIDTCSATHCADGFYGDICQFTCPVCGISLYFDQYTSKAGCNLTSCASSCIDTHESESNEGGHLTQRLIPLTIVVILIVIATCVVLWKYKWCRRPWRRECQRDIN